MNDIHAKPCENLEALELPCLCPNELHSSLQGVFHLKVFDVTLGPTHNTYTLVLSAYAGN